MSNNQDQSYYWQLDNLPNRLTLLRLLLVPILVVLLILCRYEIPSERHLYGTLAALFFVIASITDFFDGYIARKRKIVTMFGSFLDPIADKFLVVSSLIMLLSLRRIPDWIVIVLVLREMYMTSLRLFAMTENINIPVNEWGKWKTALQMIGIPMLMIYQKWWILDWRIIGTFAIYIASILSVASSLIYSVKLINTLQHNFREKFLSKNKS
jgi:CDP-diacylglycerol--glycerol-3-phosphate 3-phosphatidyltransferase